MVDNCSESRTHQNYGNEAAKVADITSPIDKQLVGALQPGTFCDITRVIECKKEKEDLFLYHGRSNEIASCTIPKQEGIRENVAKDNFDFKWERSYVVESRDIAMKTQGSDVTTLQTNTMHNKQLVICETERLAIGQIETACTAGSRNQPARNCIEYAHADVGISEGHDYQCDERSKWSSGHDEANCTENNIFALQESTSCSATVASSVALGIERTIRTMEMSNRCMHPHHWHSFRPVQLLVSILNRPTCRFCDEKIAAVVAFSSSNSIVKCVACEAFAHRTCSTTRSDLWSRRKCSVNATYVMDDEQYLDEQQQIEELQKEHREFYRHAKYTTNEETLIWRHDASITSTEADSCIPLSLIENEKSFSKIGKVLQENLVVHFVNQVQHRNEGEIGDDAKASVLKSTEHKAQINREISTTLSSTTEPVSATSNDGAGDDRNDTVNKLNVAAVAGGIAGGLAGMIIAGPAGAYAGVMAASYLVEGAVVLVVVAAGVASGSMTGQHIEQHIKNGGVLEILPRRILRMGNTTSEHSHDDRKILLVRPHIQIDAMWEHSIMVDAKHNARQRTNTFSATISILTKIPLGFSRSSSVSKHLCSKDFDILKSSNAELSINEKVVLLVNRTLNDINSIPGYVYRFLLDAFEDRCRTRLAIVESFNSVQELSPRGRRDDAHAVIKHTTATLLEEAVWNEYTALLLQRQDNSAMCINSEQLTEIIASAVETLVFGVLYHPVYEEITQNQSYELDCALQRKVKELCDSLKSSAVISLSTSKRNEMDTEEYESRCHPHHDEPTQLCSDEFERLKPHRLISSSALQALEKLPLAHSSSEKLHYCVRFLECISEEYTKALTSSLDGLSMSADSLLKMACQHIIYLYLQDIEEHENCPRREGVGIEPKSHPELNAQIVFLEEFARDEQLLRGREGYALVTIQASLHFLNTSSFEELKQEMFANIIECTSNAAVQV